MVKIHIKQANSHQWLIHSVNTTHTNQPHPLAPLELPHIPQYQMATLGLLQQVSQATGHGPTLIAISQVNSNSHIYKCNLVLLVFSLRHLRLHLEERRRLRRRHLARIRRIIQESRLLGLAGVGQCESKPTLKECSRKNVRLPDYFTVLLQNIAQ